MELQFLQFRWSTSLFSYATNGAQPSILVSNFKIGSFFSYKDKLSKAMQTCKALWFTNLVA